MKLSDLEKLVALFETSGITEMEVEQEGSRVVLKKGAPVVAPPLVYAPAPHQHISAPAIAETSLHHVGGDARENVPNPNYKVILSPMVGTFYRSGSPTANPFVETGGAIRKGQVLCIIEAMKLMNEIESEIDGKIVRIFPENGSPVEFGEPLFEIDPRS
ncbi:MAG: acetyl-CoA carboxylase biotin carboxyl carrier protein [Nitrospinae bacterium]|nr:acetyl-CoA carboxylase biotin carboxyl carrier protein [Nitrospinota bacterium]